MTFILEQCQGINDKATYIIRKRCVAKGTNQHFSVDFLQTLNIYQRIQLSCSLRDKKSIILKKQLHYFHWKYNCYSLSQRKVLVDQEGIISGLSTSNPSLSCIHTHSFLSGRQKYASVSSSALCLLWESKERT